MQKSTKSFADPQLVLIDHPGGDPYDFSELARRHEPVGRPGPATLTGCRTAGTRLAPCVGHGRFGHRTG
jgi:hypothetical protein